VSTHHLSSGNAPAIAGALRSFRPRYVLGYPSSVAYFARVALELGLELPPVELFLSNAEPLSGQQREVIGAAFGCAVRDTYGMGEMAAAASECEAGTMHAWPDAGVVEVLTDEGTVSAEPGARGRLLLTGLLNEAMPLIRYEIGDRGTVPTPSACGCGRSLPELGPIEGRSADVLVTPDGRRVFWINPVFAGLPVAESQVEQAETGRVLVRVVPAPGWDPGAATTLATRLGERLGRTAVDVELVERIPRDPSGKFRPVISRIAP
jgi:phenylacetate-CoA ligase